MTRLVPDEPGHDDRGSNAIGKARSTNIAKSAKFFSELLDRKPELWHSGLSLDERRLTRRRKAAVPASHGENEGIRFKGRDREIIAGMKGWRPSA
jgi:hypothetical protein